MLYLSCISKARNPLRDQKTHEYTTIILLIVSAFIKKKKTFHVNIRIIIILYMFMTPEKCITKCLHKMYSKKTLLVSFYTDFIKCLLIFFFFFNFSHSCKIYWMCHWIKNVKVYLFMFHHIPLLSLCFFTFFRPYPIHSHIINDTCNLSIIMLIVFDDLGIFSLV